MNKELRIKNHGKRNSIIHLLTPRGFTLIEILIAIAIIGVLSTIGIAMLNPLEQTKKGRDAQRKNDLFAIRNALDAYNSDNNFYPSSDNNKIKDGDNVISWGDAWEPYIIKLPKDPLSPQQDYYYEVAKDKTWYKVFARLERSDDPQIIHGSESSFYNFAISSTNIAAVLPTPTPTPTPTPGPKYVFVTSQTYNGNLGGLTGGDAKCQTRADAQNSLSIVKNKTWKAWLSTSSQNAIDRITNEKYVRIDGQIIANDKNDLINSTIAHPINITEINDIITGSEQRVWTGTETNGQGAFDTCLDWTKNDFSMDGEEGAVASTSEWTSGTANECAKLNKLYCFEQ